MVVVAHLNTSQLFKLRLEILLHKLILLQVVYMHSKLIIYYMKIVFVAIRKAKYKKR